MKKLLSLLTITTLTASVPTPLLANTTLTRVKRGVGVTSKDVTNNYWTFIANINKEDAVKNKDKYYFVIYKNKGESNWQIYKMQMGKPNDRPIFDTNIVERHKAFYCWDGVGEPNLPEINSSTGEITDWKGFDIKIKEKYGKDNMILIKSQNKPFNTVDNKYYIVVWKGDDWNITKFKNDKKLEKMDSIKVLEEKNGYKLKLHRYSLNYEVDLNDYVPSSYTNYPWRRDDGTYFKAVYRWYGNGEPTTPTINKETGEIRWKQPTKNDFQKGISFALADGSKTATWSNAGMRLTVDGETNININNPNVVEVYWDGTKQNMLGGKVNINVKPETSEKTHKLVIKYDINGTKYTSEDIEIVMAAKIEPPTTIVPKQLHDLIRTTDLDNINDNNDETIKTKIIEKNSLAIDFSQIKITDKTDTQVTLSAIEGSKSYAGSVDVTYNIVPATTVDLKIDVTSSASGVQIDKDYLAQLDSSKMTNKVDTFYYANGKSVIKIKQPSTGNVITGKIFGCDDKWNKTSQSSNIDPTSGLEIDKGQYGSVDGRYLIELQHKDLPTHTKTIYLQVSEKQKVQHYWDTPNGKQFEQWAEDNGYKNIRGYSDSQLNNLFDLSKTWKQSLAHLDLKLDNFVVANIKNVTQDEIDTYKTKLLASVKSQVEKYAPNVVENTDYVISVDNLVVGDWTVSKDVKVQAVNGSTKLLSFAIKTIPVQQKEQPIPATPTPDNEKDGDSKLWIIGVVVGVLVGLGLAYLLFKRFVFDKYIYPKIIARRHNKLVEQIKKEEAEKDAQNNKGGEE